MYCADDGQTSLNQLGQLQHQAKPNLPQYLTKETAKSQVGIEAHASRIDGIALALDGLIGSASLEPFSLASIARSVELSSEALLR